MAVKDWLGITEKTLDTIDKLNDEQVNSVKESLDRTFAQISREMLALYGNLEGADPDYIKVELSKLNQLKIARQLLSPQQAKEFEKEFKQLLDNQTAEGIKYADLMTEALTNPPELVQQFGTINIDTVAIAQNATERLKNHTKEASQKIMDVVSDNLLRGGSVQQLSKNLQGILGTTKARAETIARTETVTAFNQASRNRYQEYGAEYLQIIAIVDQRTTPWCRHRHLKIIKITDSIPSYHWNCRSTTAPVDPKWIDEDDLKWMQEEMKRARDTGLSVAGKAPFDTKKPTFITPQTFVKTSASVTTPSKQNSRKSELLSPVSQSITAQTPSQKATKTTTTTKKAKTKLKPSFSVPQEFTPSQPYPFYPNKLTKDRAIEIGDEYIKWVLAQNNFIKDPFNSRLAYGTTMPLSDFIRTDLHRRGRERFARKKYNIEDYYEIINKKNDTNGLTDEQAKILKPIIEDTIYLLGGGLHFRKLKFIYSGQRGYYIDKAKTINVGDGIERDPYNTGLQRSLLTTVAHEIGHSFESQSQTFLNNSFQFILDKATGKERKLKSIVRGSNYRDDEIAYPDKFIDPYVGKKYTENNVPFATEVFSMGIEELGSLHTKPSNLMIKFGKDPDHLKYILGNLLILYED